jgi:alanine-glyoxylate transaminase/(R)-3-amino-2-methylpropionate-pyruvate transaminase
VTDSATIRAKHAKHLFPAARTYYDEAVVLDSGQGSRVRDLDGTEYLDFFGGILTVSVGHNNPRVSEAVIAQVQRISHTSALYPTVPMVELAERLANITPGKLEKSFFTASGTEADETAVMMAQLATGNTELIALRHGYSGRSMLGQSLTAHGSWRAMPSQIAAIKHAHAPYCYRCPFKLKPESCNMQCARDIEELIVTTTTGRIAGMLAEPVLGVGGFVVPPKAYFEVAAEIVRKYGGVYIADEIQTGFGRTGTLWAIEQFGIEPEMMTMAKGIANGLPLGAVIATPAIADTLTKPSTSTFGGNPISTAAAHAVLDEIEEHELIENARVMGERMHAGMKAIQERHPAIIGDVRGLGLMQAFELVVDETRGDRTPNPAAKTALFAETKKRGLLIGAGGLYGNIIRMSPMLNVTADEIDEGVRILSDSFDAMAAG